ncbi:HD domain-containing protein [Anatilimnocola sp. NA78]|uniref:HD domain-containing protein n=1 Tax=Anatilimnocola sp. NA78 TaxID=3415683 RepID=UPI003CE4E103
MPQPLSSCAQSDILEATAEHIRKLLTGDSSGHDFFHIERVWKTAVAIGKGERADLFVVELAALLHDIADWKFHGGDDEAGPKAAREWMMGLGVPKETIDHVCDIIATLSFKGAGVATPMKTLEGKCVQDADRLDAIGAVGIGRAFAYGGHKGREMYDPAVPPTPHDSFGSYKKNTGPTINHFYEKLLLLKDRMNTNVGRQLAAERHRFMEQFLEQFFAEWKGER